jgi:hypothetical protein
VVHLLVSSDDVSTPLASLGGDLLAWTHVRAEDLYGVPLPRGSWPLDDGRWVSPHGFDATVRYFRRTLGRSGTLFLELAGHLEGAAAVLHLLPVDAEHTTWGCIQIVLAGERTTIYILPPIPRSGEPHRKRIARGSSNGRTQDSDSCYLGSNPSPRTEEVAA